MTTPPPTPQVHVLNWDAIIAVANGQRAAIDSLLPPPDAYMAALLMLVMERRRLACVHEDTTLTRAQVMLGLISDLGQFAHAWATGGIPIEFPVGTEPKDGDSAADAAQAALKKMTGGAP
jgi:hypothetical protein